MNLINNLLKKLLKSSVQIKFKRLSSQAIKPSKKSKGAAGFDIHAAVNVTVFPNKTVKVPCGFAVEIPEGYELQMRPRSGLALMHSITLINTPGTIDSDYRGEVCALIHNLGKEAFTINSGDRIAQLVLNELPDIKIVEVSHLSSTERSSGGFGSTGRR